MSNTVNRAIQAIKQVFPISGSKHTLELEDIEVVDSDLDSMDYHKQDKVKNQGSSYSSDLKATMVLKDKTTGKVIDKSKITIASIPVLTGRGTYIVGGTEYTLVNQYRLKPGVYNRITANGLFQSEFNMQGMAFKVQLDPGSNKFYFLVKNSKIPAYPILRNLGVTDQEMESSWGKQILASNASESEDKHVLRFVKALGNQAISNVDTGVEYIKKQMATWNLDPEVTKRTLGKSFSNVDPQAILQSTINLISIAKNEKEPDDRDSLEFKKIMSSEDFVAERIIKNAGNIKRKVMMNIDRKMKVRDILSYKTINTPVESLFTQSNLSMPPEQNNPLTFLSDFTKVTVTGEGGIENERQITDATRNVNVSQMGFIDAQHTAESASAGVTGHATIGFMKKDNEPHTLVYDIKNKQMTTLTPMDLSDKTIAFYDQYDWSGVTPKAKTKMVKAIASKRESLVDSKMVDYIQPSPKTMFGFNTNLLPFLPSIQGNRTGMAAKHLDQAVSLVNREAPLVQTSYDINKDKTFEDMVGQRTSHYSPVNGEVLKIDGDGYIHIKENKTGKVHKVSTYKNFHLNQKSYINSTPIVSVGDKVKDGQVLADTNYSKDGTLALGTNLKVGYLAFRGLTHEDGVIISESASRKLTSEHLYKESVPRHPSHTFDIYKFTSIFPSAINSSQKSKLDDEGVIKIGEELHNGDILFAYLEKRESDPIRDVLRKFYKKMSTYKPRIEVWDKSSPGKVVKVNKTRESVTVFIKTEEVAVVGDKLSNRSAAKGIITAIIPDKEMPFTADGETIEMLYNPHGVVSRINPSQIYETIAGKVAKKTGKRVVVNNFEDGDFNDKIEKLIKVHGIEDKETVEDPTVGVLENKALVGNQYIIKLKHKIEDKAKTSARGWEQPYSPATMQPSSGKGVGGQSLDIGAMYGMLAHGAVKNLREMATLKSEKNDELWRAVQNNTLLPPPRPTFAWEKMKAMLNVAGVNIDKRGRYLHLIPFTDKDVSKVSKGKISDATTIYAKNLAEEKGGLFDPTITGGLKGDKWSHIDLPEKMPNPIFEKAIKSISKIDSATYLGIMSGKIRVDNKGKITSNKDADSGFKGIENILSNINTKKELSEVTASLKSLSGDALDKANKRMRYLKALIDNKLTPTDYMIKKIPVLPPKFRPIYPLPDGSIRTSDINLLYKDLFLASKSLDEGKELPDDHKAEIRQEVYDGIKALYGLGNPLSSRSRQNEVKGVLSLLAGTQPKTGYFQESVMKKRQNISGRTTITPDPDLNMDTIGLPRNMARTMWKQFVTQKLVAQGFSVLDADKMIKDKDHRAENMLEMVSKERPVLLNRAPSLHKFSIMAFNPILTDKASLSLPPVVYGAFNADNDGDQMAIHTPLTQEAVREAREKMLPSKNIFSPVVNNKMMVEITQEAIIGLHFLSEEGPSSNKIYINIEDAEKAYTSGEIKVNTFVNIGGATTTLGRARINNVLPDDIKIKGTLDKAEVKNILLEVSRKHPSDFSVILNKLKKLGDDYAYKKGFSIGLNDLKMTNKKHRDSVFKRYEEMASKVKKTTNIDDSNRQIASMYLTAVNKIMDKAIPDMKSSDNAFYRMVHSGARGNMTQLRQMIVAPGLVADASNNPIPIPLKKSYAEGLDLSDYWTASYGARKGLIEKVISQSKPGELSKELLSNSISIVVAEKDCGTNNGITYKVGDEAAINRYLASPTGSMKKNDLVTPDSFRMLRREGITTIKARSPLNCESSHGVCAYCYGPNSENGSLTEIGTNIGAMSAQGMVEPVQQMLLNSFHTGGVVTELTSNKGTVYEQVEDIFRVPKILPNKATLSPVKGRVKNVEKNPAGGHNITIEDIHGNMIKEYAPVSVKVNVRKGNIVDRGDALTTGISHPSELVKYKGIHETRKHLSDYMDSIWGKFKINRPTIETVVRGLTNLTKINNAPEASGYFAGDYAPHSVVESYNRTLVKEVDTEDSIGHRLFSNVDVGSKRFIKGEEITPEIAREMKALKIKTVKIKSDPIVHEPQIKSTETMHKFSPDWIAKMNYRGIKDAIIEGVSKGHVSDLHGYNPASGFAYGAEFSGESKKDGWY